MNKEIKELKQFVGEISFYIPYESSIVVLATDEAHARQIFTDMFDKRPNLTIAQVSELPDQFQVKFNDKISSEEKEDTSDNVVPFNKVN